MPNIEYGDPRLPARFWNKIYPEPNTGCWLSAASGPFGYASYSRGGGHNERAHRVSYEIFVGPIAHDLVIDHLCRARACVNPSHLEAVTPQENVLRGIGVAAVRAAAERCLAGHELAGVNLYLTPNGRRQCRTCRAEASRRYRLRQAIGGERVA